MVQVYPQRKHNLVYNDRQTCGSWESLLVSWLNDWRFNILIRHSAPPICGFHIMFLLKAPLINNRVLRGEILWGLRFDLCRGRCWGIERNKSLRACTKKSKADHISTYCFKASLAASKLTFLTDSGRSSDRFSSRQIPLHLDSSSSWEIGWKPTHHPSRMTTSTGACTVVLSSRPMGRRSPWPSNKLLSNLGSSIAPDWEHFF